MEHRAPLKPHEILPFPGMQCHIEEVIGCGSNAICYKGWYPDLLNPGQRHHVLIKELFPYHLQGRVWRDERNNITAAEEANAFFQMHRESFEAGNDVHLRLLADHPEALGANLNSFSLNGTLYSVLGYSGGRSLQTEISGKIPELRQTVLRMLLLLEALEAFHKSGYLHLDISPDNIMLIGNGERERMFLIDYNSARAVGSSESVYISLKAGYSAPEVETSAASEIQYSSDLYSVAAVFFRCLMGRALTLEETLRSKAPDGKESLCLSAVPQTVSSMAARILKKGLHVLPGKRYQSIGQMRQAFAELLDRIDCVGVTHWALWENGKRSVEEWIRINPSLRYLQDPDSLYPIRLKYNGSISLEQYLDALLQPGGKSGMILAQGGMGKTTLLLHTAMLQGKRYSSLMPAIFYVSLGGWNGSDTQYIQNQLLSRLRFKREMTTYDSALHALRQLLSQPLKAKSGEVPVVLLLLDGLNEIRGNPEPLIREINDLVQLSGVRILAASRTQETSLKLDTAELAPLQVEDLEAALGKRGILMPRSQDMLQLLRTPLILSIYLQACSAGKQLDVRNEEELLKAYLDSLYRKELLCLDEKSPERWQLDVALHYVLPQIAAQAERSGGSLSSSQLLKLVEKCWKLLHSRSLQKVFPEWIGHSREIFGSAGNPEQWYGVIVHQILWQRLGLLMCSEAGGYQVYHQRVSEYLGQEGRCRESLIRRKKVSLGILGSAAVLSLFLCLTLFWMPRNYDEKKTEQVIDSVVLCYSTYGNRATELHALMGYLQENNTEDFLFWYERYADAAEQDAVFTDLEQGYLIRIEELCQSGDQVPWSGEAFSGEQASVLVEESSQRLAVYTEYLPLLKGWAQSAGARKSCPEFSGQFQQLLEVDARIMSKLYYESCEPHIASGNPLWREAIEKLLAMVPYSGTEPEEKLANLYEQRNQIQQALASSASWVRLICREEGLLLEGASS